MSLLDNMLDAESGSSPRCPIKLYCLENEALGEELLEAIDAKSDGQYILAATRISAYLNTAGTKMSAPAIRNHRRAECACTA